jgi:NAD(P)-dependent dehydrogenase (short-subunit alcohol dehydrogenase family)
MLDEIVDAIARGELRPLPATSFPLGAAREAFRLMAQARHVGKIVLSAGPSGAPISPAATYWITGGLGGIGLETARWLVRAGARSVVLSGRRPPGPAAAAVVRELEAQGATVRSFEADASDAATMRRVLDAIRETLPPLRGVFHAAGAVDDAVLLHQTWDRCRAVLRGKAHGAWVLHELTRDLPLDLFVLYSAAGVFLGAPGQGAYPAANAELDALAQARRRLGLPALSVAWGPWADVGMAAELAARGNDVWAARGLGRITPEVGFGRLEELLREGATCAAILPIRWDTFLGQLPPGADRAFFDAMAAGSPPAPAPPPRSGQPAALAARLAAMPAAARRPALMAHIAERALQVIGLDAATAVDPRVPLKELGLDSLMAVELRNALARSAGRPLSATVVFDHPTLEALTAHLAAALELEAGGPRATPPGGAVRAEVAALSDEEAEAQLLAELETGGKER